MTRLDELLYLNKIYFESICRYCNEKTSICEQCHYNIDGDIRKEKELCLKT